ncbi:MAG TPA: DUF934 domain-containing protein [Burkholderiales bacterium]|nr:DUF934 domain-containing protein [Burkholderiales bacterium]
MFKLIGNEVVGQWKILVPTERPENARLPVGPVIVPLALWRARRAELIRREYDHGWPLGVWLSAEESAEEIEEDIDDFTVIAIEFDRYSDGLGYTSASLLRNRYGFRGELMAIGDISDKIARLKHFGFDAFSPRSVGQRRRPTRLQLSLAP